MAKSNPNYDGAFEAAKAGEGYEAARKNHVGNSTYDMFKKPDFTREDLERDWLTKVPKAPGGKSPDVFGDEVGKAQRKFYADKFKQALAGSGDGDGVDKMLDREYKLALIERVRNPNNGGQNNGHGSNEVQMLKEQLRQMSDDARYKDVLTEIRRLSDNRAQQSNGNLTGGDLVKMIVPFINNSLKPADGGGDISKLVEGIKALQSASDMFREKGEKSKAEVISDMVSGVVDSAIKSKGVQDALTGVGAKMASEALNKEQDAKLQAIQSAREQKAGLSAIQSARALKPGNPNNPVSPDAKHSDRADSDGAQGGSSSITNVSPSGPNHPLANLEGVDTSTASGHSQLLAAGMESSGIFPDLVNITDSDPRPAARRAKIQENLPSPSKEDDIRAMIVEKEREEASRLDAAEEVSKIEASKKKSKNMAFGDMVHISKGSTADPSRGE